MIGTDHNAPFIHNNSDCKCKNSRLCYPCHKHVATTDLRIIFDTEFWKLFCKKFKL